MAKPEVTLFVDIVSPFSYMAFYMLRNSSIFASCETTYIPILLGGLMKTCGTVAPLYIKNKDKWINVERLRWARSFNIPMRDKVPEGFPVNTVGIQRALCAIEQSTPEKLPDIVSALYKAYWVEGKPVNKPDVLVPVLASVLGEDVAKEMVEKSTSKEAKDRLGKNTDLAFQEGAFGLPWFVATNAKGEKEGFWGFDHIGQVIDHLVLERPKEGTQKEAGWRAML